MATQTITVSSTNKKSSAEASDATKAAEIYRKDCGGIYYVCYHCGIHLSSVSDMLVHIDHHYRKIDPVSMDTVDVKCELLDNLTEEVADPNQLERIFIDCSKSMAMNEEQCLQTNVGAAYAVVPIRHTSNENYFEMEGHFEWKCLHCSSLWKKFAQLKQHLCKHVQDPLPSVVQNSNDRETSTTKSVQYSFRCTLCPSEFYDSNSARQHVKKHRDPEPIKCTPCGRKFVSTQLLTDHVSAVHGNDNGNQEVNVDPNKTNNDQHTEKNSKTLLSQNNTFLCILCNKTFNGTLNLMQHTFVHFDLKNFSCTQCPAKFRRMATINEHMEKKHSSQMDERIFNIQCRFCSEKAENLFEFVTHTFTNHLDEGDKNNSDLDSMFAYECRFCFKNFLSWNNAHRHLDAHANDELPMCIPLATVRSYSERAKSGLYRSELLYNCSECKKTLRGSLEARHHWITEHKNVVRKKIVSRPISNKQTGKKEISNKQTEKKEYRKCDDCDDLFCTQFNLMKHRLKHFKVQPYSCSVCAKRFSIGKNATIHRYKVHNLKQDDNFVQLDCHYCKAELTDERDFITHTYNEHLYVNFNIDEDLDGQCKYECLYCKEIITKRIEMGQHLEIHQNETIPETDANTTSTEYESLNTLRHKVEFVYCCVFCPKKFRLPHPAGEHVKYKHKTEMKSIQQRDEKPPTTIRDTHCSLCNITFSTWRSMLNHRAKRHPETHNKDRYKNRPTYYCSTCGKAYRDKGNLNQHEETHARLTSYTCDICNKTYRTKNYIQLHLMSHRNEKNFICDQCGRSFYSVSKLNSHSQVHQNLKLECDVCNKVFFTRYNLSKHKKTHTTDTRKKCKLCDNYFKSTNSYRTHMLLHTGIKKYACRYCDMTFAQSSGRRGHEKMRHHIA